MKKEKKKERTPEQQKRADDAAMIGTVLFSLVFAIALFMMLPAFIGELIDKVIWSIRKIRTAITTKSPK